MGKDSAQDDTDLRFIVAVRDTAHLEVALRNLSRTASVVHAARS
jgi:guanosine-3',5'-bis(diphosphate) 3'-pyrophosphohydrolase